MKHSMYDNMIKNRFWLWQAISTYGLGVVFLIRGSTSSYLGILDDPPMIFNIAVVGTLTIVYALWDINHLAFKTVVASSTTFVWLLFLVAFTFEEHAGGHWIGIENMYAAVTLGRLVFEVIFDD